MFQKNYKLLIGLFAGVIIMGVFVLPKNLISDLSPFALFLICPLMMLFMGGHGHKKEGGENK